MDIRKWLVSSKPKDSSSNTGNKKDRPKKAEDSPSSSGNAKHSKKRRIIESDSDEEPIPQKEKASNKNKSPKARENGKNSSKPPKASFKEVTASDFFGSESVSSTNKKAKSPKKKTNDISLHEDEEFEATLMQLNDVKPIKNDSQEKKKPDPVSAKKDNKKGNSLPTKRKANSVTSPKVEIIPNPKAPPKKKIIIDSKDEKPAAKKPRNSGAANYASYLNREGPKALGSKEIPEGAEGCLAGLTFIITGVLESIERDEGKALVEKYGGKVMTTITKNTKYIIIGRDAGASKLEKAEKFGTIQLDEDGLLDLIRTRPGKDGVVASKSVKKEKLEKASASSTENSDVPKDSLEASFLEDDDDMDLFDESPLIETKEAVNKIVKKDNSVEELPEPKKKNVVPEKMEIDADMKNTIVKSDSPLSLSMWVDKYKPSNIKQVIGQQGDKSNAKKLLHWLVNWRKNRRLNKKAIPGRFNANDDGSGFKAALLSGPPGVGKTTTAQLVCKESGYDFFELNASDTRSKKTLQQMVSQLLGNQTLADCFKDDAGKVSSNHVIIMDEVDGMAGNEDRGGMMELIGFIKASKVPIICICNDRNHTKIRSLSNYCFDLRFQRPRVEQIKAAMMSIAFKEHIKVSPEALQDVIVASNQDVRQVLHNMSMWSAKSKGLTSEQTKADIGRGTKHIKMGPFDVLREVFAIGNNPKATIMDKSDLFFHDYSLSPLFVQENYVHVIPTEAQGDKKKHLRLLSAAADSICIGDMIDRQIRNQNSWSLLPTQAIFASVVPGELLKGHLKQMINFPAWLGKNSNHKHMDRVLQELHVHMRMRITGNKTDVALEYLPLLKRALTKPLIERESEGIPDVLKIMENYFLLREDFDSIIDLSLWPNQTDPRTKIITKVKSAFTRAYNKESGKNPYAITNVKKKKGASKDVEDGLDEDNDVVSEEEEDEDIEKDAMIKVKKPTKKSAADSSEPSTSKDKKKNPSKRGKAK
uniref:Replication factor C subunit 1 n=1 Tax=Parasteatoda tepidariorum TaxID=114398 RepID=A0A2L2Y705_PARTP